MRRGLLILAALSLAACMGEGDMTAVEQAVATFHQRQAADQDLENYREAAGGFRDSASLEDFARLNAAVRAARGCDAPRRNPSQWRANRSTDGYFVVVVYDRSCEGGPLSETFTLRFNQDGPRLFGYQIEGMALFAPAPAGPPDPGKPPLPPPAPEQPPGEPI